MQIITQTTYTSVAAEVIPVLKRDDLSDSLAVIARRINVPETVLQRDFKADRNETLSMYGADGNRFVLLGLGKSPVSMDWLKAFRKLFFSEKNKWPQEVLVDLRGVEGNVVEPVVIGIRMGGYDLGLYKTGKQETTGLYSEQGKLTLLTDVGMLETAMPALARAEAIAQTQTAMLDIMNAPASHKSPQTLADWAIKSGKNYNYAVTVLDKPELERQGLGALLSVSQGSEKPPVLIIAEHKPTASGRNENWPVVGLVGKGVTFDTGGVSIKTSNNMHLMKSDMGGAAAVLGTVEVAAKLNLPVHLIGIVPSTENSIDGRSTKPGDVVQSYTGKTIEVIDTDAEGRVILADGLGYMVRNFRPDIVIDLATLTGSVISALGYHAAGLFTQNDELAAQLIASGDKTGERLWRLPLWDAYTEDIKSDVADLKNFSGKPIAGSISAAKFLEVFTERNEDEAGEERFHPAWAHLDIAGTAFADTEFGSQKNATGFGIRLLIDYLQHLGANQ
ncbi:leucyl aminopeptidase [Spirosoma terrae]|uniref:Probable cytosol aminopeptidase n=1 Tax=Spirosoma terrae TaxID=1968276 RepID=A0A6L9LDN4_9BACT|nr:leucyl aminopeptidase family protein [Spirosoma terrae]NDU98645.1 leucyl aminopeptidase family protein [Spirosoma terrae]